MSEPGEYENFDLLVERNGESFRVSVLSSPAGEGEAELTPPYSEEELQKILTRLANPQRDVRSAISPRETVKKLGTRLFEGLFRDKVGNLWISSRERVRAANKGLRLRLSFREDAATFESWPWELLFDPFSGRFLAQSERTPVVRYLKLPNVAESLHAEPPLRMLVAIAQPNGYQALDADREWERARHALKPWMDEGWLTLERLERATLEELRRSLVKPCHILHIVGHGHFDRKQNQGSVVLEEETGKARLVPGDTLGAILAAQRELRLVVLNVCEGALTLKDDPSAGVAQALVGCRIPAVIAMRSRISDLGAITFAEHFYSALGRNLPVDVALAEARHGMLSRRDDLEWAAPVLYTRSSDCRLFRLPEPGTETAASSAALGQGRAGRVPWPAWAAGAALLAGGALYPFMRNMPADPKSPKDPNLAYVALNPTECPSPLDPPIAFVKVPAGSFLSSSKPQREVTIPKPFCISRFEVTQEQWKKIMGDNPSGHKGDTLPVEAVLWEEIEEFLKRLNARSPGANYRLPDNAQWEYAARAGTAGAVSFDGNLEALSRYGNCQGRGSENSTIPVGSLAANPWGIFDMYGNVAELVRDEPLSATATPGVNALASVLPEKHVRRGGSFRTKPENCDSLNQPAVQSRRNKDTGFRVIRDLKR